MIRISRFSRSKIEFLTIAFALISLLSVSCDGTQLPRVHDAVIPTIREVSINSNTHNVVSAIVTVDLLDAVEIAIEYGIESTAMEMTPFMPVLESTTTVPVLGLVAESSYTMRAIAISATGHRIKSEDFLYTTGSLPSNLPKLSLLTNDLESMDSYVMLGFASGNESSGYYALIINRTADVVWYREFSNPVVDFQKQENGYYTVWSSIDDSPSHFYELDMLGNITREFKASGDFSTGPHEIKVSKDEFCLFAIEMKEMDLRSVGGKSNAEVKNSILECHKGTDPLFSWSPLAHLSITDAATDIELDKPQVNPWHGNAFEQDHDGNMLISLRNSDEVVKVDTQTGDVIWRLGGRQNQFVFVNDPLNGFSHQHGIRRLSNNNIILFDNGNLHSPQVSRAVEYKIDESAKIAELVWEYRHETTVYGFALGFAQRLENGNTLIHFGTGQRVTEVTPSGITHWEISIDEPEVYAYRAFTINTLY